MTPGLRQILFSGGDPTLFRLDVASGTYPSGETFTRAGAAYYLDSSGVLQSAGTGVKRNAHYINGKPTLLLEGARTNVVLWDRDMTNAAWTKTTMTAAKDQVGPDGVTNSASSLLATAGNATCLQAITLASSARSQSCWIKRLIGSGTVNMTMDNGSTWTVVTVTASWTRVNIPTQTLANPTVGFRIVTDTDKIAVDFAQNEDDVFPSSEIATTTASVARVADVLTYPYLPIPQEMTVFVRLYKQGATADYPGNRVVLIGSGFTKCFLLDFTGSGNRLLYNGLTATKQVAITPSVGTRGVSLELCGQLSASGAPIISHSENGGAIQTAVAASDPLPPAWVGGIINIGNIDNSAFSAFRDVLIVKGIRDIGFFRGKIAP